MPIFNERARSISNYFRIHSNINLNANNSHNNTNLEEGSIKNLSDATHIQKDSHKKHRFSKQVLSKKLPSKSKPKFNKKQIIQKHSPQKDQNE